MKFVNLTAHPILLPGDRQIPPSGQVARCRQEYITIAIVDGIELTRELLTGVTNLPESENGTIYIVSMMVRRAANYRSDLASPGKQLRDENGKIIGALHLVIN